MKTHERYSFAMMVLWAPIVVIDVCDYLKVSSRSMAWHAFDGFMMLWAILFFAEHARRFLS